jgi:LPXTG-motif cell wall-anchored protein
MRKTVFVFLMALLLVPFSVKNLKAQEQPKPKKDTVNMDTDAKPQFYYAVEDEKEGAKKSSGKSAATIAIVAGAVVVVGAAGFFLLRKKK